MDGIPRTQLQHGWRYRGTEVSMIAPTVPKVVVVAVKEGDDLPFFFIVMDVFFIFLLG
jgi:hypothetical protein